MAYGNPQSGLLGAILVYIEKEGNDREFNTNEVAEALQSEGHWPEGAPPTYLREVNRAFSQNTDRLFTRISSGVYRRRLYVGTQGAAVARRGDSPQPGSADSLPLQPPPSSSEIQKLAEELDGRGEFDPESLVDARQRVMALIARRRGQPKFRADLLEAYGGRCAISRCDAEEALEAAHIIPYQGELTNRVKNGILLRADLHTLFDRWLIAINPQSRLIAISISLRGTQYVEFEGKPVTFPIDPTSWPDARALQLHFNGFSSLLRR